MAIVSRNLSNSNTRRICTPMDKMALLVMVRSDRILEKISLAHESVPDMPSISFAIKSMYMIAMEYTFFKFEIYCYSLFSSVAILGMK